MDNLTHGLLGLAVSATRKPRGDEGDRAIPLACVIAAELPDLDTLWPAGDEVLSALLAHRGPTHALLAAPVVALVAAAIGKLAFRRAPFGETFAFALAAVIVAHLIPDAWTGWGTRLWLPFSDARVTWDTTLVVDPLVTLPLLAGAVWGAFRRERWRRAVLVGAAITAVYLGARVAIRAAWLDRVERHFAEADRVEVFPAWFSLTTWRFVAVLPDRYEAGVVGLPGVEIQARHPRARPPLPSCVNEVAPVREALAWARLPLVSATPTDGGLSLSVSDLRYHLGGAPTLRFEFELGPTCAVRSSRLDRGGSARELLRRLRGSSGSPR